MTPLPTPIMPLACRYPDPPLVFTLLEVVPCPEGHQVGIVCGGGVRDAPCAAHISVAELVGETLQLIGCEVIIIPQDMVVGGAAGALQRDNTYIDNSSRGHYTELPSRNMTS